MAWVTETAVVTPSVGTTPLALTPVTTLPDGEQGVVLVEVTQTATNQSDKVFVDVRLVVDGKEVAGADFATPSGFSTALLAQSRFPYAFHVSGVEQFRVYGWMEEGSTQTLDSVSVTFTHGT